MVFVAILSVCLSIEGDQSEEVTVGLQKGAVDCESALCSAAGFCGESAGTL